MVAGGFRRKLSAEARDAVRALFACDDAVTEVIAQLAREAPLADGSVLWPVAGRDETTLITRGRAQEVAYGRDGGMLLLHLLGAGDLYGGLMDGDGNATSQVEAMSEGRGAHFSSGSLVRLMDSYSAVGLAINRQLAQRLQAMRQRMVETALLSATGRVCSELLRRSRRFPDRVIRPMPVMSELALSVQSTRETVSRTVSQLEKRGIVRRIDGGLEIVAPHRLEEQAY